MESGDIHLESVSPASRSYFQVAAQAVSSCEDGGIVSALRDIYLLFIDFCVNISCSCTKSKYSLPFRCWSKEGISSFFSMFSIKATSLQS